jgi:Na+-transporting methylmalonyl-CoA/oxaloacetate decarboxylase gamma subunit
MVFRYYTNVISQATRSFARGTFLFGLFLVGFGVLILALPAVFAFLAAMVFFIGGFGAVITAIKMFLANRRMDKMNSDDRGDYRENVRVRIEQHEEF